MSKKKGKKKPPKLSESKEFQKFRSLVAESKRILISTHTIPDGDGLGAETALFHYLKKAKKSCRVYNPDRLPTRYQFLDPKDAILRGPGQVEIWDTFDLWVIVDTNDLARLGPLWAELSIRAKKVVFLDHHPDVDNQKAKDYPPHAFVVSDTESSSIGELLYHLFSELNLVKLNFDIALGLYVSIMTDTNSFRYSRTTSTAHRIAAETIDLGVNPETIYQSIYSSKTVSHLKLLGHMLQNVKTSAKGKLAWLELGLNDRKAHKASVDDTQSFLNLLLLLKDAEIVCLFREEEEGKVRVSMKSTGRIVVNRIATELGGGGHAFAAGLAISASLKKTVEAVTERLEIAIDHFEKFGK